MTIETAEFTESKYQSLIEYILRDAFRSEGRFEIAHYQGQQENKLGYDLEVKALIPLFLQIKVSKFYPALSTSPLCRTRTTLGYKDTPGMYGFKLHPDLNTGFYKQHNLLAALHSMGNYARYIAPLFHTIKASEYYAYHRPEPRLGTFHSVLRDSKIPNAHVFWLDYFYFAHSLAIAPHMPISDSTKIPHHYCYSHRGDISFHSDPKKIEQPEIFFSRTVVQELLRRERNDAVSLAQLNQMMAAAIHKVLSDNPPGNAKSRSFYDFIRSLIDSFDGSIEVFHRLANYLERSCGITTVVGYYDW